MKLSKILFIALALVAYASDVITAIMTQDVAWWNGCNDCIQSAASSRSGFEVHKLFDGSDTFWNPTDGCRNCWRSFSLDLGNVYDITGFALKQDGDTIHDATKIILESGLSANSQNWELHGEYALTIGSSSSQVVTTTLLTARYIRLSFYCDYQARPRNLELNLGCTAGYTGYARLPSLISLIDASVARNAGINPTANEVDGIPDLAVDAGSTGMYWFESNVAAWPGTVSWDTFTECPSTLFRAWFKLVCWGLCLPVRDVIT